MMGMYRGGGENFDLNLSNELAKKGHEIEIFHLRPLFGRVQLDMPPYAVSRPVKAPWLYQWTQYLHLLPVIGRIRGLRGFPRAIGQFVFEIHAFFKLWLRRKEDFVVHICGLGMLGMLATKVLGKKVYVRFPGPPSFKMHYWFIKNINVVIANGDAYETIKSHFQNIDLIKLDVGINHDLFTKACKKTDARNELGLSKDKILLLFVGRFVQIKNVPMLIKVLAQVRKYRSDVELVLVGDGSEKISLQNQAEQLGVLNQVHFVGRAKGDKLKLFYSAADMFLLSSHYDNFPNVILEAMAMELPVIATRVGGVPSQIEDGITGYLVDPDGYEDMAKYILMLADDVSKRNIISQSAADNVKEKYNWNRTAELFLQRALYKDVSINQKDHY